MSRYRLLECDHIAAWRSGYFHHGIYVGNSVVIEFTNDSKVRPITYDKFRVTSEVYRVPYESHQCYTREEVVGRAHLYVAKGYGKYNLLENNCEHFAFFIKTGKPSSVQAFLAKLGGAYLLCPFLGFSPTQGKNEHAA